MVGTEAVLQGRYRVVRPLGRGGMGAVYEATDLRLSRTVAIKETLAETDELRRAFERESRLLANLRHAALPKVLDHFAEGDGLFLVMEFIPGEDLGRTLERDGRPFPPAEVLRWAGQLLDALEYLHTLDPPVLHRDIKPSNIKLLAPGHVVLLDFGLAKGIAGGMTRTGSQSLLAYSPNYSPLEQMQGAGTDERSDLYSLGATLYHLLTGLKPPDALTRATAVLNGHPDPLLPAHHAHEQVPAHVSAALMRAMALNVENRPRTAAQMREELSDTSVRGAATVPVGGAGETGRVSPREGRGRTGVAERVRSPRVVVPLPEETLVVRRRGGRGRAWLLGLGLLAGFITVSAALYFFSPGAGSGRRAQTSPTPRTVSTPTPTPAPTVDAQANLAAPPPGPAELAARERLAERNIAFSEESFGRVVEDGDTSAVDLFLAAGMSPDAKDAAGRTALIRAASRGSNHISRKLLMGGADPNARDASGATALMEAAERDHRETTEVLLAGRADVNLRDNEGRTALLRAAAQGHSHVVRMLLERGARTDFRDRQGRNALAWAERNDRSDVVELLRKAGAARP